MSADTSAVSLLVLGLEQIEAKLESSFRPGLTHPQYGQLPLEELCRLKAAIDRVHPVLLLYINGASSARQTPQSPVCTVSSLMEDAFHISDRYLTPKDLRRQPQLRLVDNGK